MLVVIWLILILLGFVANKSKIVSLLDLTFFIIASGFRTQGNDWNIYAAEYRWAPYQTSVDVKYPGFLSFEQFSINHGLDFKKFLVFAAIVGGCLLFLGIYCFSENPNAIFSLFLLYPFGHEATQMKSFIADVIIYCSIPLILKIKPETKTREKIFRICCYLLLNYIAIQFQFSVAFYVLSTIVYLLLYKKDAYKYLLPITFISFFIVYSGIFNPILRSLNARAQDYIEINTRFGMIIPIGITILLLVLDEELIKLCKNANLKEINKIPIENFQKYSQCILLMIPLLCYDITFNRLWRLFLLLTYTVFAKFLYLKKISINSKGVISISLALIILIIMVYEQEFTIIFGFLMNNRVFG